MNSSGNSILTCGTSRLGLSFGSFVSSSWIGRLSWWMALPRGIWRSSLTLYPPPGYLYGSTVHGVVHATSQFRNRLIQVLHGKEDPLRHLIFSYIRSETRKLIETEGLRSSFLWSRGENDATRGGFTSPAVGRKRRGTQPEDVRNSRSLLIFSVLLNRKELNALPLSLSLALSLSLSLSLSTRAHTFVYIYLYIYWSIWCFAFHALP